jgi:hypothetical protein
MCEQASGVFETQEESARKDNKNRVDGNILQRQTNDIQHDFHSL